MAWTFGITVIIVWKALRYLPFFLELPDNGYASSWTLSMEQCRESQLSSYLLGDIILNNPRLVCNRMPPQFKVLWVGVARQMYTSIDQGMYLIIDTIIIIA